MSNIKEKTGLFLGKFSIFHSGHQFVIDQALLEVDRLIILIYDSPSSTPIPLDVRAKWIETIYSNSPITVIQGWCGPEETGYTEDIINLQNEYIKKVVGDREITHFFSSEPYGEHVSKTLNCINRVIDMTRQTIPISASDIQKKPYQYREFINPIVYKDLITNIVFLGAPSTGKTTIAEKLANEHNTVWMPEYGREYWEKNEIKRRLEPWQLTKIAEEHILRENEKLLEADQFLFTDTNAITTFMFAKSYHGSAEEKLSYLAEQCIKRYDFFFLCEDDIPYEDSWDRSGEVNRLIFQRQIKSDLLQRGIPFISLSGPLDERINKVDYILRSYKKWSGIGDSFINF